MRAGGLLVGLSVATIATACGSSPRAEGGARDVTVTSFNFPESRTVAEIYAQALERAGYTIERALDLASREVVEPALEQGVVDLAPE
jgi:osmoprotectant transport system substrate-binding protein